MSGQTIISTSPEATWVLAQSLAATLQPGAVLALHGDLGSGKTCFVKGLARALDVQSPVTSPTFTLINEYNGRLQLHHIDLYRLNSEVAVQGLGLDDYLDSDGVTVIEWAERAGMLLPPRTIHLRFEVLPDANSRRIRVDVPVGAGVGVKAGPPIAHGIN